MDTNFTINPHQGIWLEDLPPELKLMVASYLPNVRCLRSLALSGPVRRGCAMRYEGELCRQAVRNQYASDTLSDLIMVYECSRVAEQPWKAVWAEAEVRGLLQRYGSGEMKRGRLADCNILIALELDRLSETVEWFVDRVTGEFLENGDREFVADEKEDRSSSVTATERSRITRAVCRFEWYCWLFGNQEARPFDRDFAAQREVLWDRFAPWENEELGCVHD